MKSEMKLSFIIFFNIDNTVLINFFLFLQDILQMYKSSWDTLYYDYDYYCYAIRLSVRALRLLSLSLFSTLPSPLPRLAASRFPERVRAPASDDGRMSARPPDRW